MKEAGKIILGIFTLDVSEISTACLVAAFAVLKNKAVWLGDLPVPKTNK